MGQMSKAIQMLITVGISAGAIALATGCNTAGPTTKADASGIRGDVTDVHPSAPAVTAAYQPPLYDTSTNIPTAQQPITAEPVADATPSPVSKYSPTLSTTPTASKSIGGKKTHIVRHGETLFSIAKASYGDGKAWKKIVSANPGVSPSKLKVGQVLVLPASS
jgi:5'-nucleotidase